MIVDLVVKNGTLVTAEDTVEADLLISESSIVGMVAHGTDIDAKTTIDASNRLVLPGVVDPHVHISGPNTIDSYETGTQAAALGGVTSILTFAWQAWDELGPPWSADRRLHDAVERQYDAATSSLVDYSVHGVIGREDPAVLNEIEDLVDSGIVSFKLFTTYDFGLSNGFIERVFNKIEATDSVAVLHTEDDSICSTREMTMRENGRGEPTAYPDSRPTHAEAMAADDAVRMAQQVGNKYYGIHTSCQAAAEVLQTAQADKSQIRGETCVHYTTLDRSQYATRGLLPMIAPPLRTPDDIEAMFEHLQTGTLDVVSTDHVAFTRKDKQADNWWDSEYGANGVQRSLPVFHDEAVVKRDLSYPDLVRLMCSNPARLFGLVDKGTLEPGTDADFVLFDPNETQKIDASDNASQADYSIYEGREVTGKVDATYLRGECIAADGAVVGENGYGSRLNRVPPNWSE
ncbi:dihydroorotase family protein [Haloquadratum walsbyi]|uniref:Dihydroorotase related cyclic amidohydrolase n=1 Tax=Haloquadratum walsbyi J07HQW2 TaxID=1238425 RepID=U1N2P3_9EURY|nr:amidohydrolase family protein [Haloquadratum walsbyi]ERG97154.1 MAG: dihydroorotase related cyclic amidohydrolase [Haloquadratum walsbyi J07HQW2]